jgi:hypothetical protein
MIFFKVIKENAISYKFLIKLNFTFKALKHELYENKTKIHNFMHI